MSSEKPQFTLRGLFYFVTVFSVGCAAGYYLWPEFDHPDLLGSCGGLGPHFVRANDLWFEKQCDCGWPDQHAIVERRWLPKLRINCSACDKDFKQVTEAYIKKRVEELEAAGEAWGYSGTFSPGDWCPWRRSKGKWLKL